ncbi:MAG: L,D-transpeptidase [Myxococcales bacterium]|nr:L,D-transpeptidase [Myxococcales bacterium]
MRRKLPLFASAVAIAAVVGLDGATVSQVVTEGSRVVTEGARWWSSIAVEAGASPPLARAEPSGLAATLPTAPPEREWPELSPPDAAPEAAPAGPVTDPSPEAVDPTEPPTIEQDAEPESSTLPSPEEDGDDVEDEDVAAEEPDAEGPPILASLARETWIYAEPRWKSRRLGYLRAGAVVSREAEPTTHSGCRRGWYRIEPQGYVCHNKAATLDPKHPVVELSRRPRMHDLPYTYVQSRYPTPPLYARLPTDAQQKRNEPARAHHLRKHERLARDPDFVPLPDPDPIPELLANNAVIPGLRGQHRGPGAVLLGHARVRSGFALLGTYDVEGRRFGVTTEMAALPLDRTRVVAPSTMEGVHLSDEFDLPIAIVKSKHARRWIPHPDTGALAVDGDLPWRSAVALTGRVVRRGGVDYHEARDGSFLRADRVVRIDRFRKAPRWAQSGKKWVDVSILRQALVAYEGQRPVYATLVSTGADGIQDHEETHATIQGTFLIHTKHVSVTMDGDDAGDEFDLRDVPFVQYFTEGYALHGAYWHDDFGTPRSHGCVNLAPKDAAWLFRWTDPEVPEGWHAALSLKKGTTVYIHP